MRNSIFLAILINICSISIIVAVYLCYKSIVATQDDIRKDIANLNEVVRNEVVFDIIESKGGEIDIENCCDMTLTCGTPICMEKKCLNIEAKQSPQ